MLLFVAYGHQANEFARLHEIVFEVDRAVGIHFGRNMQDGDGVKVAFGACLRTGVPDDAHFGGQGA